jgi:hypothetical protein
MSAAETEAQLVQGAQADAALLSNAAPCHRLLGYPATTPGELMETVARWVEARGASLSKPAKFQAVDGRHWWERLTMPVDKASRPARQGQFMLDEGLRGEGVLRQKGQAGQRVARRPCGVLAPLCLLALFALPKAPQAAGRPENELTLPGQTGRLTAAAPSTRTWATTGL